MKRTMVGVATILLATVVGIQVAAAAEATVVKVALLDMSSLFGAGPARRGMMGAPMMQNGWGMPGWWGQGPGQGGWMGPGMMGQGPRAGMMGMMSLRADHSTVRSGAVHFDVTNWSKGMLHEMLVIAVDEPGAPLPYDYGEAKVPEQQVQILGDTSELQPNASGSLDVTLAPGAYLLICNIEGHYASGMATALTVTP